MRVQVTPLRVRGRRTAGYGTSSPRPASGSLGLHTQAGASATYSVATLKGAAPKDPELLPPLYEPVLVAITGNGLLLRGFESIDGASFVQEWHCVFGAAA